MKTYPLLQSQMGVFVECLKYPESTQYNLPTITKLVEGVDLARLENALYTIVREREELRIRFQLDAQGNPVQYASEDGLFRVLRKSMKDSEVMSYAQNDFIRPFDLLGSEALFRAEIVETEKGAYLLQDYHHILMDGVSCYFYINRDTRDAYSKGKVQPIAYGMLDHVQTEVLSGKNYERDRAYFLDKFKGLSMASLSAGSSNPMGRLLRESSFLEIGPVHTWCAENKVAVDVLFLAAFSHVLLTYMHTDRTAFSMTSEARFDRKLRDSYGMYVNTHPVLTEEKPDMTVREFIAATSAEKMSAMRHHFYPFTHFCQELRVVPGIGFNFLALDNSEEMVYLDEGLECPILRTNPAMASEDLTASIYCGREAYEVRVTSSEKMNDRRLLAAFASAVKCAAENMMNCPDARISEISTLSPEEEKAVCALSAGEDIDYGNSGTWLDLFCACAKSYPQDVAIVDAKGSMTYRELDEQSDSVAAYLIANGIEKNDFVAVKTGRVREYAIALMGIQKAGAAYVPVDMEYPQERIQYMLEDSGAKAVLTEELVDQIAAEYKNAEKINRASRDGYAYMIYTSGSTGRPKGVIQSHRSLRHFVDWRVDKLEIRHGNNYGHFNGFAFDGSLDDLACPLAAGAAVYILDEELRRNIVQLDEYIEKNHIAGMTTSTLFGMELVKYNPAVKLDYLMMGGEKLYPCGDTKVKLINGYGPTEFTVCSSYYVVKGDETDIPIGRPVPGTASYICDANGHLLAQGVTGELCLAGPQIAEGYWKQPELSAEKFTQITVNGQKVNVYKTGDLARYNADGQLEYIGRSDNQVKLRGYRVELGEIDSQAMRLPGVDQAAADVHNGQIVLYYTIENAAAVQENQQAAAQEDQQTAAQKDRLAFEEEMHRALAESLADYMLPSVYMRLEALPLTPNGKIDRKALPEPETVFAQNYVEPETPVEQAVVQCMQQVLGENYRIGALDSFFAFGGDSIRAIRLASLLRERDIQIRVSDIMAKKTVRAIAACAAEHRQEAFISQEPVEGAVADSAIVRFYKDLELPVPAHFHQAVLLRVNGRADRDALQEALHAVTVQHDMLRAVVKDGGLYIRKADTIIEVAEYQASSEEEVTSVCHGLLSGFHLEESLFAAALIRMKESNFVFLAAHHLIIDGVSLRILVSDLETAYSAALRGEKIRLAAKTSSYSAYVEALEQYRESYHLEKQIPYWNRVQENLLRLPVSSTKDYKRHFARVSASMNEDATTAFVQADKENLHLDVNDILLAAAARAFCALQHKDAVSVQLEGHGRENFSEGLVTDRTVGWFTSIYPVVFRGISGAADETGLCADLVRVKEELRAVPDKGAGYNVLRYLDNGRAVNYEKDRTAQLGFNYLGEMDAEQGADHLFGVENGISVGAMSAEENCFGPDLAIDSMIVNGRFQLQLAYNEAMYGQADAQALADGILAQIRQISGFLDAWKETVLTASDLGETEWSPEEFSAVNADFAARNEKIKRIYPLLPMQEGILFKHMSEPEAWAYRLVNIFEMNALPGQEQLRRALDRLSAKYEVLRTAIVYEHVPVPRQVITDRVLPFEMRDISGEKDPLAAAGKIRQELLCGAFDDLQRKPLFRMVCAKKDEKSCYLITAVHHIIVDGWSLQNYMLDLFAILKEETGSAAHVPQSGASMDGLHEAYVRQILELDKKKALQYWADLLSGYENRAEIPSYGDAADTGASSQDTEDMGVSPQDAKNALQSAENGAKNGEVLVTIDRETTRRLNTLCKEEKATISNAVELVWGLVLASCSNADDVVFAKVVSGRDKSDADLGSLTGLFINSVPVRVTFDDATTVRQLLGSLQQQAAQSNAYDYCGLSEIQQQTALGKQLLQTVLAFENYSSGAQARDEGNNGISITPVLIKEENYGELNIAASVTGEGELCLHLTYDRTLYTDTQIRRIGELFCVLAEGAANTPDEAAAHLPRVSESDKKALCTLAAAEKLSYNKQETWLDRFNACVEKYPDRTAVTDSEGSITYRELQEQSDIIARYLVENGVQPDSFVALKMDRVKEFVIALTGVHKAGAAYVPLDPAYPAERLDYMLENSQAKILLTEDLVRSVLAQGNSGAEKFVSLASPERYAYMIYTSGTTGRPKGVVIHHAALMNYTLATARHNELTCEDRIGHHFSFSFDSHIEDIYPVLTVGAGVFIMPENIRREPELIARFLKENRITGVGFTTTIGRMILTEYPQDLGCVRYAALMGEALTDVVSTVPQILNKYGPTETTNICAWYRLEYGKTYRRIPIGRAMDNGYIFILDRHGNLLPRGVAGEICYAGPQVGRGYWRSEDRTGAAFSDCPFVEGIRMYHTGDLGRYNEDGVIECLGRIDTQIKLRGYRVELGEIESRAAMFPGVAQAAADVKNGRLGLYYIAEAPVAEDELNRFMAESLAEYMVPAFYMALDKMPRTPSGKVDRKHLPLPDFSGIQKTEPADDLERTLLHLAEEVLGAEGFGVTDNMISLGLSSLAVMRLAADIQKTLGAHVTVAELMKIPTVREIARNIRKAQEAPDEKAVLSARPKQAYYPITENQKGVYLDWEMNQETTQYNVPSVYVLEHIDADRLADAVRQAVDAHAYLKTRLEYVNGELMQKVWDEEPQLVRTQLDAQPDAAYFQGKVRPFDLLKDRLYRIEIACYEDCTWLFIDAHHIIYDGLSNGLLIHDILKIYHGEAPTEETVSALDFALFEQDYKESREYAAAQEYFRGLVNGAQALVYPDSAVPDTAVKGGKEYGLVTCRIPAESIDRFCHQNQVTAGAFMQAAFSETLKRVTREEGAVYVTISSGRSVDPQLLGCIGMFARTLPVTVGTADDPAYTTADYVKDTYRQMQQTLEHEMYPYTRIVEDYGIHAEIMFVFQGGVFESGEVEGAAQLPLQLNTVKFAISATAYPENEDYVISLEYDGKRYCAEDMLAFAKAMGNVALGMADSALLRDVGLLDAQEEQRILALSTGDRLDYDRSGTWVDLFLQAAKDYPDNEAVVDQTSSITYRELDIQSDRVAAYLAENGVRPNTFVAVKMDRVKEFVTAVLGIHKAGAAYVPIDASYPEDRIRYMLEDSRAHVVLTEETLEQIQKEGRPAEKRSCAAPGNLAYMIYTSGSTGKPKGAMVPHSALHNFVHFIIGRLNMRPESRIACHTSFSFDVTVENLFPVLCTGGCTIIVPEAVRKDVDLLYGFFKEFRVTGTHITTQMGQLLGSQYNLEMEYIRLSGEAMTSVPKCTGHVYNAYGPTECTVDVSDCEVDESYAGKTIPIGKPMSGSSVYVTDQYGRLLPQGMAGELYLGGEQVGAGYFNKPEMTDEKFIEITLAGERHRVYKSGDLGKYLPDGQIEYLGRMDNQVKFRGFRIELGEIESRAMLYPDVEQAVAMVKNEQLVLYYTKRSADLDEEELHRFLAKELTDYMLPTVYMRLEAMPLTPNGKVNRKVLPEPKLASAEHYLEPETAFERTVAKSMQKILGIAQPVGALDSFFALGGDSIKAIRLISLLRESDMELRVSDVMKLKTVRAIAACASDRRNAISIRQEPVEGSVGDSAIICYYKDLNLPVPAHFNQSALLRFKDNIEPAKLREALAAVTYQHDMLRAVLKDGSLYIRSADTVTEIEEYSAQTEAEVTALCEKMQAGIDMESGLFRAALIHMPNMDLLFLLAHHLIIDGVSWRILLSDLESACENVLQGQEPALPAKTSSYPDYVEALRAYRESYSLEKEIPYWTEVQSALKEMPHASAKDYSRSFASVSASLDAQQTTRLMRADREKLHLEINDILLTAVARAFCAQTGSHALSLQLEGHGREYFADTLVTDRTVGWFTAIYPVVLKGILENAGQIQSDLLQVKETLHAIPKKGAGYNVLRFLEGGRKAALSADQIALVGFNYLGEMDAEYSKDGVFTLESGIDTGRASARENSCGPDLDINCMVANGCFRLDLSFNEHRYSEETAQALAGAITEELQAVAEFLDTTQETVITPSDLGETEWNSQQFAAVTEAFAARGVKISRIYPLLPLQEGMLYKHITDPTSWGYRLVQIYEMQGLPTGEQLRRALDRLGAKYEVLRTAIVYEDVPVARQVITDRALPYELRDVSGEADPFAAACRIREEILTNGFELTNRSLFSIVCAKKDAESCYVISAAHHIIVDGWSLQNYMTDLFAYIGEELTGKKAPEEMGAGAMDGMYESYVRQVLELDKNEGLKYWDGLLSGYEKRAQIPSFGALPKEEQITGDYVLTIDKETTDRLNALCMEEKATINNAVELAWGLVLQTYSYTDDAVFAKVVSGRDKTSMDLSRLTGLFINSVPVRVKIDREVTTRQMLGRLQRQAAESNAYDFCPLPEIQQRTDLGNQLLQTVLAFENYGSGAAEAAGAEGLQIRPLVLKEENFDEMHVSAYVTEAGELCLHIAADRTLFKKEEMDRVTELFRVLVTGMADQPDMAVSQLPRLSREGAEEVFALSYGGKMEYPADETWVDQFLASARKYPKHTAVVDSSSSMTYEELDEQSNAVAAYLLENGVQENTFVAIRMDRVKEYMAAILGVFKAGAAYLPIDSEYPESRVQFMLEDSGTKLVLTRELVEQAIKDHKGAPAVNHAAPDHYAYMIYTSGSTGVPKGVVELHSCLINFTHWTVPTFGYKHEGRYGILSSFAFDGSLIDYASGLAAGGTVHIFDEELRRNLIEMEEYMRTNQISGLYMPTLFGAEMAKYNPHLKVDFLQIGGIKFLPYGKTDFPVYHVYGPTEFTILSSYHPVEDGNNANTPIGRPAPNNWGIICDKFGNPVPRGVIGELFLAGAQRAAGYWKRPELTEEKFVTCQINGEPMKAYRTGDLVRYNEDGFLEYYDRIDSMIKFRGFRVELGEIEHRAMEHPAVEYAVVDIKRDQLVLYYTIYAHMMQEKPGREELTAFLAETLADYMVPSFYVELEEMPKTQNGKVDKSALPEPVVTSSEEYVEPATPAESAVAQSMQKILGITEPVGALDSFFALGGDSIKAIRLVSQLREHDLQVRVSDVMSLKTVRAIAAFASEQADAAMISQEPVTGVVTDSAIVRFYKDLALPEPEASRLVQSVLLKMTEAADLPKLQEAFHAVTVQHDMLRAVVTDGVLSVREPEAQIAIEEYETEQAEVPALCTDIQDHLELGGAMVRAALLHTKEGDLLFITAHHLIIDGVSWRILTSDLEMAYDSLLRTGSAKLPAKTSSYQAYAKALQQYRDSGRLSREIPYWDDVQARLLAMPTSSMKDYDRSFSTLSVSMDSASTAGFIRADREKLHLEINDILLAAVARAYCRQKGCDALSVQMEGHGREPFADGLHLDRTIGWFTSIYPVVFTGITAKEDPKDDVICVKETLHRVPGKGMGYGVLRYLDGERQTDYSTEQIAQIGFNYLGEMDAEHTSSGLFSVESSIDIGTEKGPQKNRFCPDLDLNSMVTGGRFTLTLAYNEAVYTEADVRKLAEAIFAELKAIAAYLDSCEETIVTATDFGETEWTEEEFEAVAEEFRLRREQICRIYPLLPMQEGMLYKHMADPDSGAYRLVYIYEMSAIPTETQLRHTLERLGKKYEVLRTAFIYEGVSAPRQVVTDRLLPCRMRDVSNEADPYRAVCEIRKEIMQKDFDLAHKPLFRLDCVKKDENSCYLLVSTHHMIVDGWSQQNYLADLFTWLCDEMAGRDPKEPTGTLDGLYETYVRQVLAMDRKEGLAYWKDLLEGYDTRTEIPSYGKVPEEKQSAEDEFVLTVDADTTEALAALCREEKATLSNAAELAWGLVLQTYSNTEDAVFAKIVSGRDKGDLDVGGLTGLFINSVPVRVKTDGEVTARQMIGRLQRQATESNAYDYCPLSEIQQQTELKSQLLQTVFAFQNYSSGAAADTESADGIQITPVLQREEVFDGLNVDAAVNEKKELCLHIAFDRSLYTGEEIRQVMRLFGRFAEAMALAPDEPLCRLARVDEEELQAVRTVSNGEQIVYPQDETWIDLFLRTAEKYPDSIAVTDATGSLTYRELDRYSDLVAASLLSINVAANEFVAIKMKRGKEFPVAVLGVQKAGAAYVPIDADYPEDRINYMLEDSEAKAIVTEDIVQIMMTGKEEPVPVNLAKPGNYAYMIYTSGSTGRPKGVIQSHRSLHQFACWRMEKLNICAGKHYGHFNSFSFDGSLDDLICPLAAGATVHIFDEDLRRNLVDMDEYIAKHAISGMTTSTQFGMELMRYNPELKLDYLMMGGEKLLPCEHKGFDVINGYGPTEFTVCSSYYVVKGGEENIPIGRPVPNTASYICDKYGNLLPRGVVGEICLAGAQMAEGYWKLPEMTKEKFTEIKVGDDLVKVYRTGDLGRYNGDGQLEYAGRTDSQVKLRGYRIEFGEIESQAVQYPQVQKAVAAVKNDQLVLYYTLKDPESADAQQMEEMEKALQAFLAEKLTEYMVPSHYMCIEEIPLTPGGKVDHNALPEPILAGRHYVAPETEYEKAVADCIQDVLGISYQVSATDNFYALGGDSIKAMRMISILRKKNIRLQVSDITKQNTVREIAAIAQENRQTGAVSQESISGRIEDSAITGFYRFLDLPRPSYFTQSMLLRVNGKAEPEKLQQALNVVTRQHDMLRAVVEEGCLYIRDENAAIELEMYEVPSGDEKKVTELCVQMKTGMDMEKALFRAALIRRGGEDLLFLLAHHLIIDGVSWRVLLPDLEAAYTALLLGQTPVLEEKTSNYRDYVEALKAYRNSDRLRREIPYWNDVQQNLMASDTADIRDYGRHFAMLDAAMDETATASLTGADRQKMNLDANDILLTAVARAFCRAENTGTVSVQMEGHGREDIGEGLHLDRTVGWFTSVYPVVLQNIGAGDDIRADLVRVKETLHNIPNRGVGYNILRYLDGEEKVDYAKDRIAKISFNYLGETAGGEDPDSLFAVETAIDTGAVGLEENCFGSDLNINCMIENGCFKLSISYNADSYGQEQVQALADSILEELQKEAAYLDGLEGNVATACDFGETAWTEEEFEAVWSDMQSRGETIEAIRPIREEQAEQLAQKAGEWEQSGYEFVGVFAIDAVPAKAAAGKVLRRMCEKYDVLRSAIVYRDVPVPRQVLVDREIACTYQSAQEAEDPARIALDLREQLLRQPIDLQKDPLFRMYCIKKDAGSSYLVLAMAPMLCDICGLSEYLLSARLIAFLAGEMGRNFRITDVVDDRQKTLFMRGDYRVCGHYNEFDASKPTFVFVYGIIFQANIQHLLDDWSSRFNMIAFDTVNFHFKELFDGETFDDVADLYMTLLEFMLPKDDPIFGFVGYSFAGELGFVMAERTKRIRGSEPIVFLGDTDMIPSMSTGAAKTLTMDDLDEYLIMKVKEHDIPQEGILFGYSMLSYFNSKVKTVKPYDGLTVLFLALRDCSQAAVEGRIFLARKVAKNLEIVEFPEWDHFTLHTDTSLHARYREVLDKYIEVYRSGRDS